MEAHGYSGRLSAPSRRRLLWNFRDLSCTSMYASFCVSFGNKQPPFPARTAPYHVFCHFFLCLMPYCKVLARDSPKETDSHSGRGRLC